VTGLSWRRDWNRRIERVLAGKRDRTSGLRQLAAQCLLGSIGVAVLTFVGFRLHLSPITAALSYLIVIVLTALTGSLVSSIFVAVVATLCLDYFFTPPLFHILLTDTQNVVELIAVSTTAFVITRLVTSLRRSAAGLREQADLLEVTHDAIFVRDMNDVITYWNRGAEVRYGWKREDAVGKVSHHLLRTIFPAPLEDIVATVLRAGSWEGELVHTRRDGAQVTAASRWSLQRDEQGRPLGTLENNNDITEHKRAEEALRKAQAELVHASRVMTMGEMTTSIAHEVNQPLSGIVTNASACLRWLAGDPPNLEEAREAARRIIRDGNRASEVIGRIRALAKKTGTEKAPMDLNAAIQDVVALTQGEVRRNGVFLRAELAGDLPSVLGDRVQLQQVVLNLVMNGIEAMSTVLDRPRELVIKTQRGDVDHVSVTVQDSGVGLDPKGGERIFDAFYSTKREGMGMGLSISRSIVENHGGRLWALPSEGPGAAFQFTVATRP
jgi:PAS domain S-box-containing protein